MKDVKLTNDIEVALNELDKIIETNKSLPLQKTSLIVDKNELREIHTKISREKYRLQELRNEYILESQEKSQAIISSAKLQASDILEESIRKTSLAEDPNIKIALEIKESSLNYLEQTLKKFQRIMNSYEDLLKEVSDHVNELNNKKMY